MTDPDDPLLPFLIGELEQIEEVVGIRSRLIVPSAPLADSSDDVQTFRWTYRFTWQQVERGRRYVIPLPREIASLALQPVISEINGLALSTLVNSSEVRRRSTSVKNLMAELGALIEGKEVRTHPIGDGSTLAYVHDESVLALPVSAVERRISYRTGLSAYSISEFVRIGSLQVLQPDFIWVISSDSG